MGWMAILVMLAPIILLTVTLAPLFTLQTQTKKQNLTFRLENEVNKKSFSSCSKFMLVNIKRSRGVMLFIEIRKL